MENLKKLAEYILAEARVRGADSAQCSVSETETREFNVDGGEFSLMRTLFDRSVSISVLRGGRKGSVSINRFDEATLGDAVAACMDAAESAEPDDAYEFAPGPETDSFVIGVPEPDTEKLFFRTREFMDDVASRHPKLLMEQLIVFHERGKTVYMNSNGVRYDTIAGSYHIITTYSAHDGEDSTSMYGGMTTTDTLDAPFIELALIDQEMGQVEAQLGAKPVEGKFVGTAVFAPACLVGDVFSQIVSNFASDQPLIEGTSRWKDSLGARVADERVSLTLAPHDTRIVRGRRYTGEGYPAEDFSIIRDGVLEAFCLTQYGANKLGLPRGGNDSSAYVVKPGDTPLADIIAGIERGVLLMRFSGGHPSASGEFSGVAKNGFLIENGALAGAITGTMISGNLAEMLQNVRAASREILADGDVVAPYMAFDGITVSGA